MKTLLIAAMAALTMASGALAQDGGRMSDAKVRQAIIAESIASYSGSCPCPYNTMRNGRSCGGRSAYSRPGGASPICYDRDVTPEMIEQWKASHR